MNYAVETIRKAMKIYQVKHGGTLPEVSILFVNVMEAFDEAAQQSVEPTVTALRGPASRITDEDIEAINLI